MYFENDSVETSWHKVGRVASSPFKEKDWEIQEATGVGGMTD